MIFYFLMIQNQKFLIIQKKIKSLINLKLSSVNFYEHEPNVNDILQEKDRYFDCELIILILVLLFLVKIIFIFNQKKNFF